MVDGAVLIVGGTGGIGREVAAHYQRHGNPVIITGRDASSAIAWDLSETGVKVTLV